MSVGPSIVANYASQLYASLLGILLVPLYIQYMGIEAYGLVGFYAMLQGWFVILDMGVSATLNRESARLNAGVLAALDLRRLVRSFEGIFLVVALGATLTLVAAAPLLTTEWLDFDKLDPGEVERAVMLMAVVVVLRWTCGLYRGIIMGFERIVWLSGFNSLIATFRFLLVVPYLAYVGASPTHFFAYQLAVAAFECAALIVKSYRLLPSVDVSGWIRWSFRPIRPVARFTLSVAATSVVWVFLVQADKLLLSGMVPLADYAIYTMAVLVASGVTLLSSPVTAAILPRLTRLHAEGDEASLRSLYRMGTQIVGVIVIPAVLVLAFFPIEVIIAWTGDHAIATLAAPILTLYAVGNGILAFAAFSYLIQIARGSMKMHLVGNAIFALIFVPLLIFAVARFGMVGAGWAWLLANLIPFAAWVPLVHRRFLKGLHLRWMVQDIGMIAMPPTLIAALIARGGEWAATPIEIAIRLGAVYALLLVLAAGSSSCLLSHLRNRISTSRAV